MQFGTPEIGGCETLRQAGLLLCALARNEFVLHYQPYFDLCTGNIVGVEALVRWQHPVHGLLYPDTFIPIVERSGLITILGEWVMRKACTQMKDWQISGLELRSISVNVSPLQFDQSTLLASVHSMLTQIDLAPELLNIEITESSMPLDPSKMYQAVAALRRLGVKISIDDFGIGYSSLERLRMIQVDRIKIDRVFISHLVSNPIDQCLVKAMMTIAQQLGLNTIAEGIEQFDTLAMLRSFGCEQGQGFYFSPPLSGADCDRYLRQV